MEIYFRDNKKGKIWMKGHVKSSFHAFTTEVEDEKKWIWSVKAFFQLTFVLTKFKILLENLFIMLELWKHL